MLRINLLPAYIAERRKRNVAIGVSIVMLVLPCVALVLFELNLNAQAADWKAKADDAQTRKDAIDAITAQATSTLAKVQPIIDKKNFVENLRFYNTLPGRVYAQAARYTIREAEYSAMNASQNSLTMQGFISGHTGAQAVANFGRYLITFFGNPDITTLSVNGLPGYPSPATGTGTAGALGGFPGPGGFPGGPPAGFGGPPGGFPGGPPAGFGGPPAGFGGPPGGFPGGGAGGAAATQPGIPFTATATLKHAITAPTPPGGTAGGGGFGGFGGPPPGAFGPPGGFGPPPGAGPGGVRAGG